MRYESKPLTTGDVARYCGVSRQGVIRWIKQGKLEAYRTPGGHYRIQKAHFRNFLEKFDMPVDDGFFGGGAQHVLVIASDATVLEQVVEALSVLPEQYEIDFAIDSPSALAKIERFK